MTQKITACGKILSWKGLILQLTLSFRYFFFFYFHLQLIVRNKGMVLILAYHIRASSG